LSSKKRRKAREWMAVETERRKKAVVEARYKGFREGADRMHADMTALVPQESQTPRYNEDGTIDRMHFIPQFPDPRARGSHFRVHIQVAVDAIIKTITFRPVEYKVSIGGRYGTDSIRWFAWEPVETPEGEEYTQALFAGMAGLHRAHSRLRHAGAYYRGDTAIAEAAELLEEAMDEIRRRLGRFAPEPIKRERIR
jgi:hypothetical protein